MLKINKNQKRLPIGGHQYHEHGRTFVGESADEVANKLRDFRLSNHIPVGEPLQEVLRHYLTHWPYMVVEDLDTKPEELSQDYLEWRSWLSGIWKKPPRKVITPREAKDRWDVCKGCPFNKKPDWKESKESVEFTRMAFLLRQGVAVPENMGYCSCHRADLSVFTFLDAAKTFSATKDSGKQPDCCWVK